MLIEEMPPKIYKWQKRNKNNKHNLIYERCRRGGGPYFLCRGGGQNLKLRHCIVSNFVAISLSNGVQKFGTWSPIPYIGEITRAHVPPHSTLDAVDYKGSSLP